MGEQMNNDSTGTGTGIKLNLERMTLSNSLTVGNIQSDCKIV